jgi:hypothetical protein
MLLNRSVIGFLLFIIVSASLNYAQINFRIFPSSITQTEPVISISPVNPDFLFVSAKTINTNTSVNNEGIYLSTDRGITWLGVDTCSGQYYRNHGGSPQVIIDYNNRLLLTHIGSVFLGLYSHYSDDSGKTWSNAFQITSQQAEDIQTGALTIDISPSSIYKGKIYSSWGNYVSPNAISFASTTNSGISWSPALVINGIPVLKSSGGFIRTNKDGIVYACWAGKSTADPPFNERLVGFASSTDGGTTWNYNQSIFDMNGIFGTLPSKNGIRVNGLPQLAIDNSSGSHDGWIYIVTTEINNSPAGSDPDIIFHYSSDSGKTWSAGLRVNQDPINNGKIQYFPALDVDSTGGINILFYDDRNTTSDSAEVWLTRSVDGGTTWKEQVVSNHRFKPKPIVGGASNYQGDHIALTSSGNKLYALWMDDFSGIYQIWMKILDLNILDAKDNTPPPVNFELKQNFPNPFNPETKITFTIPQRSFTSLKIYDLLGKEKAVLVNGEMDYGTHTIKFTPGTSFPSGVYIYRLLIGAYSSSKKLILIK